MDDLNKKLLALADEMEDEAQPYEGDLKDSITGWVEALREFSTPPVPQAAPSDLLGELTKLLSRFANALSNELIYGEGENASMKRYREYQAKTQAAREELVRAIAAAITAAPVIAQAATSVDALMAKWDDDGATRGAAFCELRDLARELERDLEWQRKVVDASRQHQAELLARTEEYRAALFAQQPPGQSVKYVPVDASLTDKYGNHPNDDEPRTVECIAALNARGDDKGQGLDGYWKWGFAAGFNAAQQAGASDARDAALLKELRAARTALRQIKRATNKFDEAREISVKADKRATAAILAAQKDEAGQ